MTAILTGSMTDTPPEAFHSGEQALQLLAGSRKRMAQVGNQVIRDFMPDQHRELFTKLPMMLAGSLDAQGRPWASLLVGVPGFVASPDDHTLVISARPAAADPLSEHLAAGMPIGLLGIELATRRRNRMNGHVTEVGDGVFSVQVDQSFGNCPQYIQVRQHRFRDLPETIAAPHAVAAESALLSPAATALVRAADTLFIASASAAAGSGPREQGVDVSHRGGRPGFVRVTEEDGRSVLTIPDFSGNLFFNTLGNIAINPRAGLLFVDFATGDLLTLTGTAAVVLDGPEIAAFKGAQRLLRFEPADGGRLIRGAVPLQWSEPDYAPQLARTGTWAEAEIALAQS
ncbi:pyridoxamine 5'-phosphate oxidase family protein [Ferrovibrio xuzhouensis]|uniref:Pyridoxamine 5'-phosphate oxidase family protein n=1 Tax=Ferrovibrio xuzhouensis TaxID=1576914 RepID=A0ABV7VIK0_9PROT